MTPSSTPKSDKDAFKKTRDSANAADMSSSKALQDDALTHIEGKGHDDIKKLKVQKDKP
jgi:hypothetical protein